MQFPVYSAVDQLYSLCPMDTITHWCISVQFPSHFAVVQFLLYTQGGWSAQCSSPVILYLFSCTVCFSRETRKLVQLSAVPRTFCICSVVQFVFPGRQGSWYSSVQPPRHSAGQVAHQHSILLLLLQRLYTGCSENITRFEG